MPEDDRKASFWTSLPGLLSGLAALLTAAAGGYALIRADRSGDADPTPAVQRASPAADLVEAVSISATDCNVAGLWNIDHGNGAIARLKVIQNGTAISGQGVEGKQTGVLQGTVKGRNLSFEVAWSNGHTGSYEGSVQANGRITGQNSDKSNIASQTSWSVSSIDAPCRP